MSGSFPFFSFSARNQASHSLRPLSAPLHQKSPPPRLLSLFSECQTQCSRILQNHHTVPKGLAHALDRSFFLSSLDQEHSHPTCGCSTLIRPFAPKRNPGFFVSCGLSVYSPLAPPVATATTILDFHLLFFIIFCLIDSPPVRPRFLSSLTSHLSIMICGFSCRLSPTNLYAVPRPLSKIPGHPSPTIRDRSAGLATPPSVFLRPQPSFICRYPPLAINVS